MIRSRSEWRARPPARPLTPYAPGAVEGVTVHWEGTPVSAQPGDVLMRAVQRFHIDTRGWRDIAYNLCIDQAGIVWEARGLDHTNGAHDDRYANDRTVAVCCLLGEGQTASDAMLAALADVRRIVAAHHPGATGLWPHSKWTATACPGDQLRAWITAQPATPEDDDMPLNDADKAWIKQAISEATTPIWQQVNPRGGNLRDVCEQTLNAATVAATRTGAAPVDPSALAAAIASTLGSQTAKAVADELSKRLTQ